MCIFTAGISNRSSRFLLALLACGVKKEYMENPEDRKTVVCLILMLWWREHCWAAHYPRASSSSPVALASPSEVGQNLLAHVGTFGFYLPQVGKWSASGGLNITEVPKRKGINITDSLANRSLVISTILVGSLWSKTAFFFPFTSTATEDFPRPQMCSDSTAAAASTPLGVVNSIKLACTI